MSHWLKHPTIILLFLFLLSLIGCDADTADTPNVLAPTVMINDVLYYSTGCNIQINDTSVTGYIASTVRATEFPTQNDQANIDCLNAPYCVTEEGIAVFINSNWILFEELK